MTEETSQPSGPDFTQGLALAHLTDGAMLLGHVGDQPVLLARRGREVFAIDALCTHYGAPLAEGLLVEDTVRCPWHYACFSLRTGEALRPPALNPVACWRVEQQGTAFRTTRTSLRDVGTAPPGPKQSRRKSPAYRSPTSSG